MTSNTESTEERIELPADFADHVATVSGLDTPPETLEEWWTSLSKNFSENDQTIDLVDLYSESPTRHEVHVNDRVRYSHCAMDALAAAVLEGQETVTVRSVDPVSGTPITFTVGETGLEVSHEDAMICYGSAVEAADVEAAGSLAEWAVQDDKSEVKASVCQYTNAFESEMTYEQWAADTGSVTAPIPPEKAVRLLQRLVEKHGSGTEGTGYS